ncbi:MAG: PEGA domain-containing protein [Myxococcota bacterium]
MLSRLLIVAAIAAASAPETTLANDAARARFYFEQAAADFASGRFRDALDKFFEVQRLAPSPSTLYSIAQCFDQLGEADESYFYFSRFLAAAPPDMDPQFTRTARRRLAALERAVARVQLRTDPPGAEVFIDRRDLGAYGRTPVMLALSPGPHTLWLEKTGHRAVEVKVRAARGKLLEIDRSLSEVRGRLKVRASVDGPIRVSSETGETVAEGQTPFTEALPPALYVVEVSPTGHRPARDLVRVEADAVAELDLRPEALPKPAGTLTITSNVQSAVVSIDGEAVGFTPTVLPQLTAGPRRIEVRSAGHQPYEEVVEIAPDRGFLNVTLEAPERTERSPLTWVAGGVGAAALAGALATGIMAQVSNDELDRALADPSRGDPREIRDRTTTLRDVSDGLWIGGAVSLGVGVLLYFVTERTLVRPSSGSYQIELDLP